ncbi:putative kinetochore protein nuf-2 [Wickerhamomyces ciferrii]|uniref:Kinetochore protein nuf-2 n=1 Tax=Wickerhamomyces ciferrii (strain ATCC 14091 / BCRC 22168 / CBS 111 / JCM 3599 / NBRC 0793 / NRRL Y-1031 F-60-10) TaxID=1206466 RepID=K0KUU9_WICCF|nr:putative kinetochore protein nuf-2 [Wickerhamomyces ciferrii]CCH44943.1 putative kinetochore protein nuf-2 [Wickerhamomyces ciferrii]
MSRQSSVRRQEIKTNDRFPSLDNHEIKLCLEQCDIFVTQDELDKPTSMFLQGLFQQFIEKYLGLSPIKIRQRQNSLLKNDINTDDYYTIDDEEQFNESLSLLSLSSLSFKFLQDCGVYDFTLNDLIKPDQKRVQRFLSAIINFARFRDEHLIDNEEIKYENNLKFDKFQRNLEENQNLKERIQILEKQNHGDGYLEELNSKQLLFEQELKNLRIIQENLSNEHLDYKLEKARLIKQLEDHNYLLLESKTQYEKMKNYIIESPDILTKILQDMNNSLNNDQQVLNDLELRSRKLGITIESFNIIKYDLTNCFKIIDELKIELNKEIKNKKNLNLIKEQIEESNLKFNDFNRKIQLIQRQIKSSEEKFNKTKNIRDDKYKEFDKKIDDYNDIYSKLITEKQINDQNLSSKQNYINSIEKKIYNLENSFKKEYDDTNLEIEKLNSHLKLYLNQIDEKINIPIV